MFCLREFFFPAELTRAKLTRRFPEPCRPYLGFDGPAEANRDGKTWLNDVNLLMPMLTEYAVLQIREFAFELAGESDPLPVAWPSIVEDDPAQLGHWHDWNWSRRKKFLTIFSGRDDRFAYIADNLPGAGLEKRMLKQAEAWWFADHEKMNYFRNSSDLEYPDFNPDKWVAGFGGSSNWHYPIDPNDPASAPLLMRLLDKWLDDYGDWFSRFARNAMGVNFLHAITHQINDPSNDICLPLEGCGGLDGIELNVGVHKVVCWMVETLAGLRSLNLFETTEPQHTNWQIVGKV